MKFVMLALIVATCVSCKRDTGDSVWWKNQTTITELRHKLDLARFKAETQRQYLPEMASEVAATDPEGMREEIASMAQRKERLSAETAALKEGWERFRAETLHLRRAEAISDFPGDFTLRDGRILKEVRITSIEDGGVTMTHSTGVARLRIDDLDASQEAYFGIDAELALIAQGEERRQRIAYDLWMDESLAATEAKQEKLAKERRDEEKRLADARALVAASTVARVSPLSASIGALGETSASGSNRYYSRRSVYNDRPTVLYRYYYVRPSHCEVGTPFWNRPVPIRRSTVCSPVAPIVRPIISPHSR